MPAQTWICQRDILHQLHNPIYFEQSDHWSRVENPDQHECVYRGIHSSISKSMWNHRYFLKGANHMGDAVGKQNYHLTGTPRIVIQAGTHLAHSLSFCVRFCKKTLAVLDVQLNIQNMQRQGCAQCCNIKPANIDLTLSWHRVPSDTNTWLWGHLVPSSFHCMLEKCSYLESSQLIGKARWVLGWRAGRGRPPGTSCARDTFPASSGPKQMEREVKWPLCG